MENHQLYIENKTHKNTTMELPKLKRKPRSPAQGLHRQPRPHMSSPWVNTSSTGLMQAAQVSPSIYIYIYIYTYTHIHIYSLENPKAIAYYGVMCCRHSPGTLGLWARSVTLDKRRRWPGALGHGHSPQPWTCAAQEPCGAVLLCFVVCGAVLQCALLSCGV